MPSLENNFQPLKPNKTLLETSHRDICKDGRRMMTFWNFSGYQTNRSISKVEKFYGGRCKMRITYIVWQKLSLSQSDEILNKSKIISE